MCMCVYISNILQVSHMFTTLCIYVCVVFIPLNNYCYCAPYFLGLIFIHFSVRSYGSVVAKQC